MAALNVETLIKQLGTALPMMGAKDLVASGDELRFRIGRNVNRVSIVVIRLTPADTYSIAGWRKTKCGLVPQGIIGDVYADGLHRALKSLTGLDTRL